MVIKELKLGKTISLFWCSIILTIALSCEDGEGFLEKGYDETVLLDRTGRAGKLGVDPREPLLYEQDLSGSKGSTKRFKLEIRKSRATGAIKLRSGKGNPDLYVRLDSRPTTNEYDCSSTEGDGQNESCDIKGAGIYHIMIQGKESYDGWTLKAKYKDDGGDNGNDNGGNDNGGDNGNDNGGGPDGDGKFTVTNVRDDLDNGDGQIFTDEYSDLGYNLKRWDKDVSTSNLKSYLSESQELLYHTGHGYNGGIMTSNGQLEAKDVTVETAYAIFATCLTLKDTEWKNSFGSGAKSIMGYTKVSFDSPVDDNLVRKFMSELGAGNSYLVAWYRSNNSIKNLSDRWAAYVREGSKIVEYSARSGNVPRAKFIAQPVALYESISVAKALLDRSPIFSGSVQQALLTPEPQVFERSRSVATWPSTPVYITSDEAEQAAEEVLRLTDGLPFTARLESVTPIHRCTDETSCEVVAYQVDYVHEHDGLPVRSNLTADFISVMVDDLGVHLMNSTWSHTTDVQLRNTQSPELLSSAEALTLAAESIHRFVRGNEVQFTRVESVYGVSTDLDGWKTLVPAFEFFGTDGERIVVSAVDASLLY